MLHAVGVNLQARCLVVLLAAFMCQPVPAAAVLLCVLMLPCCCAV
jgi:hypothetical protein